MIQSPAMAGHSKPRPVNPPPKNIYIYLHNKPVCASLELFQKPPSYPSTGNGGLMVV